MVKYKVSCKRNFFLYTLRENFFPYHRVAWLVAV